MGWGWLTGMMRRREEALLFDPRSVLLRLALPMNGGLPTEARILGASANRPRIGYANINRSRVLVRLRTRLKKWAIGVLGHLPGLLRLAEVGPLGKKTGARTTAVGATRTVRVVEFRTVEGVLVEFRELPQRFEQVRDFRRAGRVGRLPEDQKEPRPTCQIAFRGMPQSVVSDLVKTSRQDVLEESPQKLDAPEPHRPLGVGAAVLVAKGDVRLVHGQKPGIADRGAEDVAREVVEHRVVAVAVMLQERDPLASPDSGRYACE